MFAQSYSVFGVSFDVNGKANRIVTGVVMAPYDGNPNPTGINMIYIRSEDSSDDPYFRVVYTLGGPMVIVAADGD